MEHVVKKFGSGHTEITALKGIDFAIDAGEFVAVIGPSGSGKSTFLTIAGGLQTRRLAQFILELLISVT